MVLISFPVPASSVMNTKLLFNYFRVKNWCNNWSAMLSTWRLEKNVAGMFFIRFTCIIIICTLFTKRYIWIVHRKVIFIYMTVYFSTASVFFVRLFSWFLELSCILLQLNSGMHGSWSSQLKKWSRHRPGVAQRVGRGIALLFHYRGTRREWVVSNTPRLHFTPGKDPVPILQEAGWAPGPVWTGGKSRPHRDSIPDLPAGSSVAIPTELPGPKSSQIVGLNY